MSEKSYYGDYEKPGTIKTMDKTMDQEEVASHPSTNLKSAKQSPGTHLSEDDVRDAELIATYKGAQQTLTYILNTKTTAGKLRPLTDQEKQLVNERDLETDVHIVRLEKLLDRLSVDPDVGLTKEEAETRLKENGPNVLSPPKQQNFLLTLFLLFIAGFNWVLIIAGILDIISWEPLGDPPNPINWYLGVILFGVVCVSVLFTLFQRRKSSNILKSFKSLVPPSCHVLRSGEWVEMEAKKLQPGDIIKLELGSKVAADVRLVTCNNLQVDNSMLTGESEPVSCTTKCTSPNILDTRNVAFFGSNVVQGNAIGVVTNIGDNTTMGGISQLTGRGRQKKTTLNTELDRFVFLVVCAAIITGVICVIAWAAWIKQSYPSYLPYQVLIVDLTSVIIAFVPEGLPIAVTLTLTVVARRMARVSVLIKNLATIETFNTISVICSDKTGTLTQNKMSVSTVVFGTAESEQVRIDGSKVTEGDFAVVRDVQPNDCKHYDELLRCISLCNNSTRDSETDKVKGDASDNALFNYTEAVHDDLKAYRKQNSRLAVLPFNSRNKYMATIQKLEDGRTMLYFKGAAEAVLQRCSRMMSQDGSIKELDDAGRKLWDQRSSQLQENGERVLGFAQVELKEDHRNTFSFGDSLESSNYDTTQLVFLGFCSLLDPAKAEVPAALETCRQAHVKVWMVTGDHPKTAKAIASKIGLLSHPNIDSLELRKDDTGRVMMVGFANNVTELGAHTLTGGVRTESDNARESKPTKGRRSVLQMVVHFLRIISSTNYDNKFKPEPFDPAKVTRVFTPTPKTAEVVPTDEIDFTAPNGDQNADGSHSPTSSSSLVDGKADKTRDVEDVKIDADDLNEQWLYVAPHEDQIQRGIVLNGEQLGLLDETLWSWVLRHEEIVFARTTPEQKLLIVQQAQGRGERVAVTGDGVNDSPALRSADLGIAMQSGSEVAREAAHVVLLNNDFQSVVAGIELGRLVFDNMKKVCFYLLPGRYLHTDAYSFRQHRAGHAIHAHQFLPAVSVMLDRRCRIDGTCLRASRNKHHDSLPSQTR